MIHNKNTDEAIAFVGVNDPHTTQHPERLCRDVCSGLSWVDWSVDSQGLYSVLLRKICKHVPGFRVK